MGGGFIGGDGSVQWEIFGENVGVQSHDTRPQVVGMPTDRRRSNAWRNAVLRGASRQGRGRTERPGRLPQVQVENPAAQTQADPGVLAEQRAVVSRDAEPGHEEADVGPPSAELIRRPEQLRRLRSDAPRAAQPKATKARGNDLSTQSVPGSRSGELHPNGLYDASPHSPRRLNRFSEICSIGLRESVNHTRHSGAPFR